MSSEAVVRFKASDPWWLETPALEALATAEQDARFVIDVWDGPVEKWLGKRKDVSITEVLYQPAEWLTLWGFPNHRQSDSRWQTEGSLPWAKRLRCGRT